MDLKNQQSPLVVATGDSVIVASSQNEHKKSSVMPNTNVASANDGYRHSGDGLDIAKIIMNDIYQTMFEPARILTVSMEIVPVATLQNVSAAKVPQRDAEVQAVDDVQEKLKEEKEL